MEQTESLKQRTKHFLLYELLLAAYSAGIIHLAAFAFLFKAAES